MIIPVVFHLVYENSDQIIEKSKFDQILDFANQISNDPLSIPHIDKTNGIYRIGELGFEFRLASFDPDGNPSTGITITETNVDRIGDKVSSNGISAIKSEETGGAPPWNVDRYLNVWLGERSISLGSTVTDNSNSGDIHGIVMNIDSLQEIKTTLIHEIGHYFGLLHTWGNMTGCDDEDDGIADTPFQSQPNFECSAFENCGNKIQPGNIMDFSPSECALYFTKLQVLHMHAFTRTFKESLIDSDACFTFNLPANFQFLVTGGAIDIYSNAQFTDFSALLYNMSGQLLKTAKAIGENYLNIAYDGIPSGVYVLSIQTADERKAFKVFLK